eukprot:810013-Amphidinium_carterae.1
MSCIAALRVVCFCSNSAHLGFVQPRDERAMCATCFSTHLGLKYRLLVPSRKFKRMHDVYMKATSWPSLVLLVCSRPSTRCGIGACVVGAAGFPLYNLSYAECQTLKSCRCVHLCVKVIRIHQPFSWACLNLLDHITLHATEAVIRGYLSSLDECSSLTFGVHLGSLEPMLQCRYVEGDLGMPAWVHRCAGVLEGLVVLMRSPGCRTAYEASLTEAAFHLSRSYVGL